MQKLVLIIAALCILFVIACTGTSNPGAVPENSASRKCAADGGVDKPIFGPNGQQELCLFPDGSVCDSWAHYAGRCAKGACLRKCDYVGSRSEGWYDCNGKLLFYDNCTGEDPATAGTC